jgi:CheY-like chemotaxis protein
MLGTVVVADKSKTVRRMVEIALAKHPFELTFAEDGAAAIQAVRDGSPAVAILGASLGGVNGYEAAQQLKADAGTKGVKILLVVGKTAGFDAGSAGDSVDDHIVSPFITQQLVEKVFNAVGADVPDGKIFKSSVLNIPLAKPKAAEKPAAAPAPEPTPPAAEPDFDAETVAMDALPPMAEQAPPPVVEEAPPPPVVADAPPPPVVEEAPPPPVVEAAPPPVVEATPAAAPTGDMTADAVAQTAAAAAAAGVDAALAERIAWEVVPQLAEAILKEEIARVVRARLAG